MAIPERLEPISTNIPFPRLTKVVEALRDGNVEQVPESHSLFSEARKWQIIFEGATYEVDEFLEEVYSVALVAAKPEFIEVLVNELETELSEVVEKRDYDKAKKINSHVQDLTKLKAV